MLEEKKNKIRTKAKDKRNGENILHINKMQ